MAADTLGAASTTLREASSASQLSQEVKAAASDQPADKTKPISSKQSQPEAVQDPQKAAHQAGAGSSDSAQAEPGSGGAERGVGGKGRGGGSTGGQIPRGGDEALQDSLQAEAQRKEQAAADAAAQGQGVHCIMKVHGLGLGCRGEVAQRLMRVCGAAGLWMMRIGDARGHLDSCVCCCQAPFRGEMWQLPRQGSLAVLVRRSCSGVCNKGILWDRAVLTCTVQSSCKHAHTLLSPRGRQGCRQGPEQHGDPCQLRHALQKIS